MELTPEQAHLHERLVNDYEFFARQIQKIEPKDLTEADESVLAQYDALHGEDSIAGMVPLVFHPGQQKLIQFADAMMREVGIIRLALVKPRQVGWSTVIQGRAHWRATKTPGMKIHIVSHTNDSTRKFLRRAKKMCLATPATITPGNLIDNSKELVFQNGASYSIATAGSPDAVRSDSCHFLHASEEAFWENAEANTAAIIPALSRGYGSEGYRESSSCGKGTPWHKFILETLAGENLWRVFFDAWFNHPKYRMTPPPGWEPNDEAKEAAAMFNLDMAQLYWRAMMIKDLRALWMFKQEFPGTIHESFQAPANSLINADAVNRASSNYGKIYWNERTPLIMGCDPGRNGDRTVIAFRQGNVLRKVLVWPKMTDDRLSGIIAGFLAKGFEGEPVAKLFIDYAIGEGIAAHMRGLHYYEKVCVVNFGGESSDPRYLNKRAEMYMDMRDWFGDTGEHVVIPRSDVNTVREPEASSDDIIGDLLATPDFVQVPGTDKIKMVPKEEIRKKHGRSPDIADAIALTFAYPVYGERTAEIQKLVQEDMAHLSTSELSSILSDFI